MAAVKEEHSEEIKRKLERLRTDFEAYARIALKIKAKDGQMVPFVMNDAQKYVNDRLEKQWAEKGSIKSLVLKGRQQGISTLTSCRAAHRAFMNTGQNIFVVAHDSQATTNLFNMAKRTYDHLPEALKPKVTSSNVRELYCKSLDSGFRVGTAGTSQIGRSSTINFLHSSELAFWPDAESLWAGLLQCVPPGPGGVVIVESTARGCGGKFHSLWQDALHGRNDYDPIFTPWFWQTEYRKLTPPLDLTEDEVLWKRLYGLDDQQIAFRRSKVGELGPELFCQEYPMTEAQAFLQSGRTAFDKDQVALALKETWKPKKRMILEKEKWVERSDGELSVWQEPQAGHRYVIGADVSEGLASEKSDYSSADVLDIQTGQQCASWHGKVAPDKFGLILSALGKYFNAALVACESNNHGLTTLCYMRDVSRYPNIYVDKNIDDRGSDSRETRKLGFNTNRRTKPLIIDQLSALFREQEILGGTGINCRETILECQTYVVLDDGSYSASVGCHDDMVISYAIANFVLQQAPAYKKRNRQ